MLGVGSYFDVFNKRQIPVVVFIPSVIISMAFFIVEFTISSFLIVSLWFLTCFILSKYKLWYGADTVALLCIAMSYPLISPYIFVAGSIPFSIGFLFYSLSRKKPLTKIIHQKMPFLPALLLGLVVIFLVRVIQTGNL